MKAIIAINMLGYIGLGGGMPWRCPKDLNHFKQMTIGQTLLVGYRTAQSLPVLPGRTLIVDRREIYDLEADWCIGGAATLYKYAPIFTELHLSFINDRTVGDTSLDINRLLSLLPKRCKVFTYQYDTV